MSSVSAGHIILTLTKKVGSGRPKWGSKPRPPHEESHALLKRPPSISKQVSRCIWRKTDKGSDHLLEKANFDEFSNCIHIQVLYIKF